MKRLLIFMLVLGMASAANAAIVSFSAEPYTPGGTITITMHSDEQVVGAVLAVITDNGFGGTANAPGSWNALFTIADGGYSGLDIGLGAGDLVLATGTVNIPNYATGTLFTYTYTVPLGATGPITFTVLDYPDMGYASYINYMSGGTALTENLAGTSFTSMPEPATIALLGLGGLLLRRRK